MINIVGIASVATCMYDRRSMYVVGFHAQNRCMQIEEEYTHYTYGEEVGRKDPHGQSSFVSQQLQLVCDKSIPLLSERTETTTILP